MQGIFSEASIPSERIREELARILSSDLFCHSRRLSRFLKFVVEEALQGSTGRIKEYAIALEVFDRSPSFDPRTDPIVRVEAGRLRSKLKEYYRTAGASHEVRIDCVKGTYVPVFRTQKTTAHERKRPQTGRSAKMPSVAVMTFSDLSPAKDQECFCAGISEELAAFLSKIPGVQVAFRRYASAWEGREHDVREIGRDLNVNAILEGSVQKYGDRLRITAQLTNVADGFLLWSETHERSSSDVFEVQDEISRSIVDNLKLKLLLRDRKSDRAANR